MAKTVEQLEKELAKERERRQEVERENYELRQNIEDRDNQEAVDRFVSILDELDIDLKIEHGAFDESDYMTIGYKGEIFYTGWTIPFKTRRC